MPPSMSPSRMNALGTRLAKSAVPSAEDLDALTRVQDEYMRPLEQTGAILREKLHLADQGSFLGVSLTASNRLKTTGPIIDKLRRHTRLSAMQDIVGFRIVGDLTLRQQDELVAEIRKCFSQARVVDRRARPMHGYRAVHVIAMVEGFPVEIQVRTFSQDRWAQIMERFGDALGREIRYGEMPPDLRPATRHEVEATVANLKVLGDALAQLDEVWDRVQRTNQRLHVLRRQREEHGATYRIKKGIRTAELEMTGLRREYEKVDRAIAAAFKQLIG